MKAITFSGARIGDGVQQGKEVLFPVQYITPIGDKILLSGFTRAGKVELLGLPDDIIGLLHRPYAEGMNEQAYRERIATRIRAFEGHERLGAWSHDLLDQIRLAIEEYELGQPLKPEARQPEEDPCRMGRCKHPKNWAGTCLHWAMEHPIQCDQRR